MCAEGYETERLEFFGSETEIEAVPSFPEFARPVRALFFGCEPNAGVAANVSSKVAATIGRDLNGSRRSRDRLVN